MSSSEHLEQISFINWFKLTYKDFIIFSIPNGEYRHASIAVRLKAEGLTAGIPDMAILMPKGKMIFIEMKKTKGGILSKSQKDIIPKIENLGFTVLIGYGFLDAKTKFENYLLQKVTLD